MSDSDPRPGCASSSAAYTHATPRTRATARPPTLNDEGPHPRVLVGPAVQNLVDVLVAAHHVAPCRWWFAGEPGEADATGALRVCPLARHHSVLRIGP